MEYTKKSLLKNNEIAGQIRHSKMTMDEINAEFKAVEDNSARSGTVKAI